MAKSALLGLGAKFKMPLPRSLFYDPQNIHAKFHRHQPNLLGASGF